MSAFLGPIHFWLYNKIVNQEDLTAAIADLAVQSGWVSPAAAEEYVVRDSPALDSVIDTGNIHGWLQERIGWAETRYAQLITKIMAADAGERMAKVLESASAFGAAHVVPAGSTAEEAYKIFDSTFLNGMPCDRVNILTNQSEDMVSWEQAVDIHERYWAEAGGSPEWYYEIRKAVMDGMLSGSGLELASTGAYAWEIRKA